MPSVLFTGDFYQREIQDSSEEVCFDNFAAIIKSSDIAVTNLEAPMTNAYSKISKSGPAIKCSMNSARFLKSAGFNMVSLATNHIMDFGLDGLNSTIEECSRSGIRYMGVGKTLREARSITYSKVKDVRFAFLNFVENEFSTTNGDYPGANPLNPVQNFADIRVARQNADFVFVIVHGGHEAYQLPSPRMKSTYRFFADAGADAVIGHHTHCFSGFEVYQNVPIFYSLGNLLFSWPGEKPASWYRGFAVRFVINDGRPDFELIPYVQNEGCHRLKLLDPDERLEFDNDLMALNAIIANDEQLAAEFEKMCGRVKQTYVSYMEPHSNRILGALQRRGLLPSFFSRRKKTFLLNLIRCEAHRDIVINILSK